MRDSLKMLHEIRLSETISSQGELESFIESTIHMDFINEVVARIELMKDYYSKEECDFNEVMRTKGGINALELIMGIFSDIQANRISADKQFAEENLDVE